MSKPGVASGISVTVGTAGSVAVGRTAAVKDGRTVAEGDWASTAARRTAGQDQMQDSLASWQTPQQRGVAHEWCAGCVPSCIVI